MQDFLIAKGTWLLVCDGAKAQIYCNEGTTERLDLRTVSALSEEIPPSREIGTDRPGRSTDGVGNHKSAMDETDWHAQAENEFLGRVASEVESGILKDNVDKLIVVAPPRALGVLRSAFSDQVKKVVAHEINKDLTKLSSSQLADYFVH